MKKLSLIFGIAFFATALLTSCKDESGVFVEQLYTNAQKETAIKECLKTSADSAVNHLCKADGFYGTSYRIDYSPLQNSLIDTLSRHGYGDMVDSLILFTNRLAESCGGQILPALKTAIDSLSITDYDALINGGHNAITQYFSLLKHNYLNSAFQTPVSVRMNLYGVNETWSGMLQQYYHYSTVPLNFDLQNYIVEKMLDDVLQEMGVEEGLIRTDSTHRNEKTALLGK